MTSNDLGQTRQDGSARSEDALQTLIKVPAVTLGFWIIKILATTLGETGGDAVTMSMNLGYLVGTAIFASIFIVAVAAQVRAQRFHPSLYWAVIVATTTVGTTMADFATRDMGIGYLGGSLLLLSLLITSLAIWYWACGTVAIQSITTTKAEIFYWVTIMFSQTLGTALGDWAADSAGLGYLGAAGLFGAGLAVLTLLYFVTDVSRVFLFWAAFILTRPLGATVGDFLDKPLAQGGLELSRYAATGIIALLIIVCIATFPKIAGDHPA